MNKAIVVFVLFAFGVFCQDAGNDGSGELDFTILPELPVIFGIDFLGWGFDATYRDTFFALKPQMFKYSYKQNPTEKEYSYRYPTDTQFYSYPDQVSIRTVGKTITETYVFDSTKQERFALDIKLNIKASTPQIEGALDFGFNMVNEDQTDRKIVMNYAETGLFQLYLVANSSLLKDEVKRDMENLRLPYSVDPESYHRFIYRWGTHYVDSVVVGGSIRQRTQIDTSKSDNVMKIAVALRGKFQSASGTKVEGSIDLGIDIESHYVETETTSNSEIFGGDPEYTDFVLKAGDPEATKQLFESWKGSLVNNPVTIRYRLIEVWQLFDTKEQQQEVCKAIGTALGFLPDDDKDFCKKTSNILDGTIQKGLAVPGSS